MVYMDDGSHPIVSRYISSFSSTFFLPLSNVLSPLRVESVGLSFQFHRLLLIVPSFTLVASDVKRHR